LTSVTGAVGSFKMTLNFSEPIMCNQAGATTAWTYDANDITLSDGNAATVDPTVTAADATNTCGNTATTADSSFAVTLGTSLPADRTYTVTVTPDSALEITDIVG